MAYLPRSGFDGSRLLAPKCETARLKLPRLRFAIGASHHVEARSIDQVNESGLGNQGAKLCLRQSTGNSTGPEADLGSAVVGNGDLHHDIGQRKRAARTEDAKHLAEGRDFVKAQVVDDVVADDHVK